MARDANGNELKAGDRVIVEFEVTGVAAGREEARNVEMRAIGPDDCFRPSLFCDSKLMLKVEAPVFGEPDPADIHG